MDYSFSFFHVTQNLDKLVDGLWITLQLTVAANLVGLTFGFVLSLLALSRFRAIRWPAQLYIEFFRCTPVLLQVIWFFYCLPILFDVYLSPITMGVLALGLNLMAFNAEAYRAGIQAVPRDQMDACVALSLTPFQRTVYVVLPQAFRIALPVLITNGISILQQSSLVAIVSVSDLMYEGKLLATDSYRPLETYTVVALIYLAMALPVGQLVSWMERRQDKTLNT
ncbi:amino acid ABC transporter permease [Pseudomonas defluvii]|nr:amino acid ABC transporter permease [Pseudomonas defluvii]